MWNVVKFAMKFFPADFAPPNADFVVQDRPHRKEDAWILSRLRDACEKANSGFEEFQLGRATLAVKDFILNHLCDVYLEAMKPLMYTEPHPREDAASLRSTALSTLYTCLDVMFRLLHPFMPFVTEELWQRLPRRPTDPASIMIAPYPSPNPQWGSAEVESEVAVVLDVIRATRRVRAEYGLTKQKPKMYIRTGHAETFRIMEDFAPTLLFLCQASDLRLLREGEAPDGTSNVIAIVPGRPAEVAVGLEGMVDFDKEVASHEKKVTGLDRQIAALEKKRSDATYVAKVPEFVRAEEADKLSSMQDERARAADALHNMRVMRDAAKQPAQ
jgi:valyl-tRNA synthetase